MSVILQFGTFTQAQMIFIGLLMFSLIYAGISLRAPVAIVSWMFNMIAIIGVMAFNLDMIYFWFMTILTVISIAIAITVTAFYPD